MAGSIELFKFFQKFHRIIGIHPFQPVNQKQRCVANLIRTIFLINFVQLLCTMAAFLIFEAKSIFDYGFTCWALFCYIDSAILYLIFILQQKTTLNFIKYCEAFIEKRVQSMVAFKQLIGKIEMFNKFFCIAIFSSSALTYLTFLPYSFVRYYIFKMGRDSFHLFLPSWYPFDWKTPSGYLMAWLAQCAGGLTAGSSFIQFPNLFLGSGWLFIFIAEDITQDLTVFNNMVKTTKSKNHAELIKYFCDMVQIYLYAKECVNKFNQMKKYSLFAFFSWNVLAISSNLVTLQFQLWADDSNLFETILLFYVLTWMIIFPFLLCEPGARMTNKFEAFGDEFSQCNWYSLSSIEMQRMYIIFLSDTQHPPKMLCYANITCERDTSKKIINKAFSYFMTFRNFKP